MLKLNIKPRTILFDGAKLFMESVTPDIIKFRME